MAGKSYLINLVHPNVKGDYDDEGIPLAYWIEKFGTKTTLYTHNSCNVSGQYFTKSEIQLMIFEMLSLVNYVRDNLNCMLAKETFNIDNIIVDNKHKFMFNEVRVIPIVYDIETTDFTNMVAFLKMLVDDPLANRQLLSCHYALMHDLDRNNFIKRCYDIFDDSIGQNNKPIKELFIQAFKELDQPTKENWKKLVKFVTSDSRSPVRLVYKYGEDKSIFTRNSADILRFLHQCVVHLMQKQNQLTHAISKHDIHKIVTLYLPHIVLEMQEKLFNLKLITFEECARFFPRRI